MTNEQLRNCVVFVLLVLGAIVALAFIVGFGFEAVKWLGHTQK